MRHDNSFPERRARLLRSLEREREKMRQEHPRPPHSGQIRFYLKQDGQPDELPFHPVSPEEAYPFSKESRNHKWGHSRKTPKEQTRPHLHHATVEYACNICGTRIRERRETNHRLTGLTIIYLRPDGLPVEARYLPDEQGDWTPVTPEEFEGKTRETAKAP